jgi:hypothetical protein
MGLGIGTIHNKAQPSRALSMSSLSASLTFAPNYESTHTGHALGAFNDVRDCPERPL